MTVLTVYNTLESHANGKRFTDFNEIESQLKAINVEFERWETTSELAADASQEDVIAAYQDSIDRLNARYGFQSIDVIGLTPEHPEKSAFRQKFLAEHIHDDFEVRFFIAGCGLFYLHVADKVYAVLCTAGDLISVPANTTHWFDMGSEPSFKTIRLFTTPDGWVAKFTGDPIANHYPSLDETLAELA
jgi:1,2-dihydroxy-3-keto-5-methylthiopentene dioxygenase